MPKLRAALNALIPATEDMPRLREAPPPPPPLPPPLAPASSARLSPTSPAQPAPRSAQSPTPQYPPSAAYLSWPTCHPSPAWREPASARPTSVVPTPVPSSAPTLVAHSSTPSPNPVEALADALSKPGLEDSCRAAVVGLLLRSTLPSVQEHVRTVYRHGLPVTKDSVPLPYRWEMYKEGDPNAFKQHGKLPEWSREVGDRLRLLWQLLLHEIRARGYLQRCSPIPETARNCSQFHAAHTSKFLKFISPQSWDRLDKAGKKARLTAYLFRKCSTAPTDVGSCLLPKRGGAGPTSHGTVSGRTRRSSIVSPGMSSTHTFAASTASAPASRVLLCPMPEGVS